MPHRAGRVFTFLTNGPAITAPLGERKLDRLGEFLAEEDETHQRNPERSDTSYSLLFQNGRGFSQALAILTRFHTPESQPRAPPERPHCTRTLSPWQYPPASAMSRSLRPASPSDSPPVSMMLGRIEFTIPRFLHPLPPANPSSPLPRLSMLHRPRRPAHDPAPPSPPRSQSLHALVSTSAQPPPVQGITRTQIQRQHLVNIFVSRSQSLIPPAYPPTVFTSTSSRPCEPTIRLTSSLTAPLIRNVHTMPFQQISGSARSLAVRCKLFFIPIRHHYPSALRQKCEAHRMSSPPFRRRPAPPCP